MNERSPHLNVPEGIEKIFSYDLLLEIFRRMARVRYFELGVVDAVREKEIIYPIYLSTGQESLAAALSLELRHFLTFPQHRAHDIYLTWGGSPARLRDELLGLPTGTSGGRSGSNCLQWHENGVDIFGHHGLIGENVPQAVGASLASGRETVCFFGDGAAEEDYVLAAMGFAATHRLPVLFVCVDNNLSILTPIEVRRTWRLTNVVRGFGIKSVDVSDEPRAVLHHLQQLRSSLPALINVQVCRGYWHAGVGVDGIPAWDRYQMIRDELDRHDLTLARIAAEADAKEEMERLWGKELLLKPLGI